MLKQLKADAIVLSSLLLPRRRSGTAAERLNRFYSRQADYYDSFRARLLPGRKELIDKLPLERKKDGVWIDFGGGTAANLEAAGERLELLRSVYVVDLCSALLKVATRRREHKGWKNVHLVQADAAEFVPNEGRVDVITFSYSLSMMPGWREVLRHAISLLKPEGVIGAVDFYVSPKHGNLTQAFWPWWFKFDEVFLSPERLAHLEQLVTPIELIECRAALPYFPFGTVPYFLFLGEVIKEHSPSQPGANGTI